MKKKYDQEEIFIISQNFRYIVDKCPYSQSELTDPKNRIISPNTYNKLYSYSLLYHNDRLENLIDWCPQEKTLINICNYFNTYFQPQIGIYDLVNSLLEERNKEFISLNENHRLKWYEGLYYCYYLNISGQSFNCGIINIYHCLDGKYKCEAIMDFSQQYFNETILPRLANNISLRDIYNQEIKGLTSPYFDFSGELSLLQDAIIINLKAEKNAFSRILIIRRFDRVSTCKKYQGSIGTMLTTIYADKCTKFQHIGISATAINDIETFKSLFEFSDDSKYVIISDINEFKNQKWFDSVVDTKTEKATNSILE